MGYEIVEATATAILIVILIILAIYIYNYYIREPEVPAEEEEREALEPVTPILPPALDKTSKEYALNQIDLNLASLKRTIDKYMVDEATPEEVNEARNLATNTIEYYRSLGTKYGYKITDEDFARLLYKYFNNTIVDVDWATDAYILTHPKGTSPPRQYYAPGRDKLYAIYSNNWLHKLLISYWFDSHVSQIMSMLGEKPIYVLI